MIIVNIKFIPSPLQA